MQRVSRFPLQCRVMSYFLACRKPTVPPGTHRPQHKWNVSVGVGSYAPECSARLTSVIETLISEAAELTRAQRGRQQGGRDSHQRSEESVEPQFAAGPTKRKTTGTARSRTVYTLQHGSLSVFREEPQPALCELDSVTLHHLNCQMIFTKHCASFIDPDILKVRTRNEILLAKLQGRLVARGTVAHGGNNDKQAAQAPPLKCF